MHIDKKAGNYGLRKLDFSSIFNILTPGKLITAMMEKGGDLDAIGWISPFFTSRRQYVYADRLTSDVRVTDTSTPQGSVIKFFSFYNLYL